MRLLLNFILFGLVICSCKSFKNAISQSSCTDGTSRVTVSVSVDMSYHQNNLNDVLSICNSVKPCQSFNLNYVTYDRMELQLVYTDITESQRQELYSQLNRLGLALLSITQN